MRYGFGWILGAMLWAGAAVAQGQWTVTLTKNQAKALAELAAEPNVTAFAISPDGAWGRSWGVNNAENAGARALNYCQGELRKGKRDCILYEVAGKRVAPQVVQTRQVTKVYRPVNGRQAAAMFGLIDFDFQGNPGVARAQVDSVVKQQASLRGDKRLRDILRGRSILSPKAKGFGVTFEDTYAEQYAMADSGILKTIYDSWTVTAEGVICMYGGRVASNGNPVGTRCVILNSASDGVVSFSWGHRPGSKQKMNLIAGDARFATAR